MTYKVLSSRMTFPQGSVLSADELAGCNIEHLVATGHLAPAVESKQTKKKAEASEPEPAYDSAEEPEEQE